MYNVRFKKYPDGIQVQVFDTVVGLSTIWNSSNPINFVNKESGEFDDDRFKMINDAKEEMKKLDVLEYSHPEDILRMRKEHSEYSSFSRTINVVYELARSNVWEWFFTFTFNPDLLDRYDFDSCVKKLQNWLIVQRRNFPDLKYILVPEQHKDGAWHFHGLFANCDGMCKPSGKTINGVEVYNVGTYKWGFTTATKVNSNERVTKYISKYITKDLCKVTSGKKGIGVVAI